MWGWAGWSTPEGSGRPEYFLVLLLPTLKVCLCTTIKMHLVKPHWLQYCHSGRKKKKKKKGEREEKKKKKKINK